MCLIETYGFGSQKSESEVHFLLKHPNHMIRKLWHTLDESLKLKIIPIKRDQRRLETSEAPGSRKRRSVSAWSRIIMNQSPLYTPVSRSSWFLRVASQQWKNLQVKLWTNQSFFLSNSTKRLQIFSNSPFLFLHFFQKSPLLSPLSKTLFVKYPLYKHLFV